MPKLTAKLPEYTPYEQVNMSDGGTESVVDEGEEDGSQGDGSVEGEVHGDAGGPAEEEVGEDRGSVMPSVKKPRINAPPPKVTGRRGTGQRGRPPGKSKASLEALKAAGKASIFSFCFISFLFGCLSLLFFHFIPCLSALCASFQCCGLPFNL